MYQQTFEHTDGHINVLTDIWMFKWIDRHTIPSYIYPISQKGPISIPTCKDFSLFQSKIHTTKGTGKHY